MKEETDFSEMVFFHVFSLRLPLGTYEVTDLNLLYHKNFFDFFKQLKISDSSDKIL